MERVRRCSVYVGVLGTRYGSPVLDKPEVSYTELEFDTATEASLDRLVFLLDTEAEGVGIPLSSLIDREFGARQDAFRSRVQESGLVTRSFDSPDMLRLLVERSLHELAETRRRIETEIHREQVLPEQPIRASKFINPPPTRAPSWFRDRQDETGLLARYVTNPEIRLVFVVGRGGIGKTAMVCRLLNGLEVGRIPDVAGDLTAITPGGIVYLSPDGMHKVDYPTLVDDLSRLLPAKAARRLAGTYRQRPVAEMMLALLEALPAGKPVVVLLDNLESVMDAERESLREQALQEALSIVLTAPAHAVTVIATTRVPPTALLTVEPARQRRLPLEGGLGSPDAETVLRELDDDGHLGLRDASPEVLDGLRMLTRGYPRALEAVKAILDADETLTPQDLLGRAYVPDDQVVKVLVGEAYRLLDAPAQQVMQALSVYPAPVSAAGVDVLLRTVNPTTDALPILRRLVRRHLARFRDQHFYLHSVDSEYVRRQLPRGSPGDSPAAFTLTGLQAGAAEYYRQIRTPQETWHTLEDVRPQLAEFGLRCDADAYDAAAKVLDDIDFGYLQVWGYYRTLVDLHGRIHGRITDPAVNGTHLANFGICHFKLGDYPRAIDLYTQALAIARDTHDRQLEGRELANLGACHQSLGDYQQAIELYGQALAIARDTDNRQLESGSLGNLGSCHHRLGDYQRAIDLHTQALAIARQTGNRRLKGNELANLGHCHADLGDYRQAIDLHAQALKIARQTGNRELEGAVLGTLGFCSYLLGDYRLAIERHNQALAIARDIGDRRREGNGLSYLGLCQFSLGDYQQAIDLYTQALAIARDIGNRYGEANTLDYLGRAWLASGDVPQAVMLLGQAVNVADTTGDIEPAVTARSALAQAELQLGDPAAALAATEVGRELPYPAERPTMRLLEGLALLGLRRTRDSVRAFSEAVTAADALLARADSNVTALQARALALSGLAVATGDPERAAEAAEAFARRRASAVGVAENTRQLFNVLARYDQAGLLAEIRTGL